MARTKLSDLSNKAKRLSLPVKGAPYYVPLSGGASLGYRRNKSAGSWVARRIDEYRKSVSVIGVADDYEEADGERVFTYADACKLAIAFNPIREKEVAEAEAVRVQVLATRITVSGAINTYEADLLIRDQQPDNATRLRRHIAPEFGSRFVGSLTKDDLRGWRDALAGIGDVDDEEEDAPKPLERSTVDRLCNCMKAALNLATDRAEPGEIPSREPWEWGLQTLGNTQVARNVILPPEPIKKIVASAYADNEPFGLFVETVAVTGTRPSQIGKLQVQDLIGGFDEPKLLMPRSKKGKGKKATGPILVPITSSLARKLHFDALGRAPTAPLLLKQPYPLASMILPGSNVVQERNPWARTDHNRPFARAVRGAFPEQKMVGNYAIEEITIYAFRHTNIVNQLMGGIPVRVVASHHDTSVAMIEKHYSAYITSVSDSLVRGRLLAF